MFGLTRNRSILPISVLFFRNSFSYGWILFSWWKNKDYLFCWYGDLKREWDTVFSFYADQFVFKSYNLVLFTGDLTLSCTRVKCKCGLNSWLWSWVWTPDLQMTVLLFWDVGAEQQGIQDCSFPFFCCILADAWPAYLCEN